MSSAPVDLLAFRATARGITGLTADELGIVGDGAHQRTGGFHEGKDVLTAIGRYHGPASANIGSSGEDYSARQARDRNGLSLCASATDVGSAWSKGGRAAWLRWNNLLYAEMRDHPERLPALRAVNISLDGKTQRRYDQLHRGDGLIPSADTVTTHTHMEFWRDTEGGRTQTLGRIVQLMQAAIGGATPPPTPPEADMQLTDKFTIPNWDKDPRLQATEETSVQTALSVTQQRSYQAKLNTDLILALLKANEAADTVRDQATLAAIQAITSNGGPDAAPIVAAVNAVRDEARQRFTELAAENAALKAELAATRRAAEANLSAAEKAGLDGVPGN